MRYRLKEINKLMGLREYLMYQDIPYEECGAINEARGMNYHNYKMFLKEKVREKKAKLTEKTTPRISYIFYAGKIPVGEIAIRPILNDYWMIHSGNIGYKIRPSERNKGYGNKMLSYAIKKCRKLKMKEIYFQTLATNVYSKKIIEKNGGKLIRTDENICFYMIKI